MRSFRILNSKIQSLGLFAFVFATTSFGSAFAAGDAHHGKEIEGLPQLDFSTYGTQIFWLFVNFIVLYIFFAKKTLPDISGVIESRREKIEGDLDNAEQLKEDAEKAQAAYEAALGEAREKAATLYKDAEESVKTMTAKRADDFKAKSAKTIADTEKQVEAAKNSALGDTHAIAAEIASIAAEKIVGIPADINQAKTLVDNIGRKAA